MNIIIANLEIAKLVIPSTFKADLKEYKSNEHYFQSKKYQGTDKENYII